jgi:hypothetical protein
VWALEDACGPGGEIDAAGLDFGRTVVEIFNRPVQLVERETEGPRLDAALNGAGLRLEGPLGCGKSRLLKTCLDRRSAVRLWLRAEPTRRGAPNLLAQIARQLLAPTAQQREDPHHPPIDQAEQNRLRGLFGNARKAGGEQLTQWLMAALASAAAGLDKPIYLVIDDAEQLDTGDLDLTAHLLQAAQGGASHRLVLAGRNRSWPSTFEVLPRLELPPFKQGEMDQFAERLLTGLSLPTAVEERIVEATAGFPFALEEGMVGLIREKEVRRIYGSFFFAGQESAHYRPSPRLACHLEAEAERLGAAAPLRLAALAGTAVPTGELAAAAELFAHRPPDGWAERALAAGMARSKETPWGPGIEASCPAFGQALARSVDSKHGEKARQGVGELLAARGGSGNASWAAYRLLKGTPEGASALIEAVQSSFGRTLEREDVLTALREELASNHRRGPTTPTGCSPWPASRQSWNRRQGATTKLRPPSRAPSGWPRASTCVVRPCSSSNSASC